MLVLIVVVVAVILVAVLWVACGGGSAQASAKNRAIREARRQDQAKLRDLGRGRH